MSRGERERLRDIKEAIDAIRAHVRRLDSGDDEAEVIHDALLFQFVVIGEAVKNLSQETRQAETKIPWDDVAGLRDLIAHEYFRIEMPRILDLVEGDLSRLEKAVDRLLKKP